MSDKWKDTYVDRYSGVNRYILDEHGEPQPEPDLMVWSTWFSTDERRVVRRQEWTRPDGMDIRVSTVFLGLDHNFGMAHRLPVLWETMVFVDGEGRDQYRYTSREAAIRGHNRVVAVEGGEVLE
jgi:hypothetical protein